MRRHGEREAKKRCRGAKISAHNLCRCRRGPSNLAEFQPTGTIRVNASFLDGPYGPLEALVLPANWGFSIPPKKGDTAMDWNRVQGSWKQFTGKVKEKWGKLTDDDLTAINGRRDQLEGKIQERYGIAKDQVRKDVDAWLNQLPS
jgi:uncharacterized protein YjbJ (UPF0337 family)